MKQALTIAFCIVGLTLMSGRGEAQQPTPPKRAITPIVGDLYRFQNNFHYAVFLARIIHKIAVSLCKPLF